MKTDAKDHSNDSMTHHHFVLFHFHSYSAYNLFFAFERKRILEERSLAGNSTDGKVGYSNLTKEVAKRWNNIDSSAKLRFDELARQEKVKFKQAMSAWKKLKRQAKNQELRLRRNGGGSPSVVVSSGVDLAPVPQGDNEAPIPERFPSYSSSFVAPSVNKAPILDPFHVGSTTNPFAFHDEFRHLQQQGAQQEQQQVEVMTNQASMMPYSQGIDILAESLGSESIDWMIQAFSTP